LPQAGMAIGIAMGSFGPVLAVEEFAADLDQAFASAARVFAITDRAPVVADPANPVALTPGDIEVTDVTFAYPLKDTGIQAPTVLDGVSIHIPAGKRTAIVGASGSGKSTLAALLTRTWDPASGTVTVGGTNVAEASLTDLRSTVAYAPQRPYLFNDTLRANLVLAAPGASDEDLMRALAAVDLTDWLASEKDGLDTVVGDMGERLSGGQRQRLALARALLRDAPIYILDEATSQVDPATEARVRAGIARVAGDATIVEIAHRISAVRDADLIIVMDAGRVVETGTYAELHARGGALAALEARETNAQPSA
ncbi:MAG: ABC transporter ATP-binding protein, partial [Pauljensenia sp.]